MMKTTLLSMAAGIGSRFGTGIKQLEPVDDAGHIIMDYSIHDAIEAGFNHVVFTIRKDIEKEFKEVIGDRITSICSAHNVTVDYAFQNITIFRELCRKVVQNLGELVRLCSQRRKSSRPRLLSSMQMITMARKDSRLFMSIW